MSLLQTDLKGIPLFGRGKVRDVYDLGEKLLIVATDRISAFDWILPTAIPDKGKILTAMSVFWFYYTQDVIPNHLISANFSEFPSVLQPFKNQLEGRSMLVKKAKRIDIECVARGYLVGSGYKDLPAEKSIFMAICCRPDLKWPKSFPNHYSRRPQKKNPGMIST
jgi:phosphoribosylaminoimidazole-succinocarboxamide synthase